MMTIPLRYQTTEQRLRGLGPRTLQRIARLGLQGYSFQWDGFIWWVRYPAMMRQCGGLNELISAAKLMADQRERRRPASPSA